MKQDLSFFSEEQDNLRIVEHLDMPNLPQSLQQMLSLATTPQEQDILLMATLTAASACVPNLFFRYGPTGKRYFANLQTFIMAASASGKGIANQALEMIRVIDARYPLLIAGDSTLPAWYKALIRRNGCGYMHESEGSVITDIWRSSATNYNTALRKAAEHEPISRNRCTGQSEIPCPKLSMLLTGTFSQYRALVPSVENGYFSRLMTLVIRDTHPFDKSYVTSVGSQSAIPTQVGQSLLRTVEQVAQGGLREWSLTDEQKDKLGESMQSEYGTVIDMLGENFHSAVTRLPIQIERIAMVLTALRGSLTPALPQEEGSLYTCSEADFETAQIIGSKLLLHMAISYRLINGDAQDVVPEIKPLDPRKMLFNKLKEEYKLNELISEAQSQGVSRATVIRWNDNWQRMGQVTKIEYGHYRKVI